MLSPLTVNLRLYKDLCDFLEIATQRKPGSEEIEQIIKPIVRDMLFLTQKSELATQQD